jgi:hypothetical protein
MVSKNKQKMKAILTIPAALCLLIANAKAQRYIVTTLTLAHSLRNRLA